MTYKIQESDIRISYSAGQGTAFILKKDGNTSTTIPLGKIRPGNQTLISSYLDGCWKTVRKNPESELKRRLIGKNA